MKGMGLPYEILVVDDGSADKTAEAAVTGGAVLVDHATNLGKAEALKSG
ncbi:glycosyltransferase [Candidatus Bathyarchaeota archaeon]|nr:glycosyltransferase [Candidatus Bathyarchaeota archaeon]